VIGEGYKYPYRIYRTSSGTLGATVAGVSGADAYCQSDTSRPNSSQYKAIIADAGTSRDACRFTPNCTSASENLNWILKPNTTYFAADGQTKIGTTNSAGIFIFPVSNPIETSPVVDYWTGLSTGWQGTVNNCANWTNTSPNGAAGIGNSTNTDLISINSYSCIGSTRRFICAEQ
jgi:hypothetical protein